MMHLPRPDRVPPTSFVLPVPIDPGGVSGPTKGQARGPSWRQTSRGRYVPSDVAASTPEQRIADVAGWLPRGGAFTGWAVLRLAGGRWFDGMDGRVERPVPVQLGPHNGRRQRPGVVLHYDRTDGLAEVRGLPCVTTLQATFDEVRLSPGAVAATVALDGALFAGLVELTDFVRFVHARPGTTGIGLARQAVDLCSPYAASPPETRLRLLYEVSLGLPRPLVNVAVFDRQGRLLGYPDLLDLEAGLAIEYDGEDHRSAARHSRDVDREAALREVGLEVTRVTGGDLRDGRALGRRLLLARGRARFEAVHLRSWTVDPPG